MHSKSIRAGIVMLAMLLALIAAPVSAQKGGRLSDKATDRLSTIPHNPAMQQALRESGAAKLAVMTDGSVESLTGFSMIQLDRITGRSRIHGQDAEYTILSMVLQPDAWLDARVLPIEHPQLGSVLGTTEKWVSKRFVVESAGLESVLNTTREFAMRQVKADRMRKEVAAAEQVIALGGNEIALTSMVTADLPRERLEMLVNNETARADAYREVKALDAQQATERPLAEAASRLGDRVRLMGELPGRFFIVPDPEHPGGDWIAPLAAAPEQLEFDEVASAIRFEEALHDAFASENPEAVKKAVATYKREAAAMPLYPKENFLGLKNLWYKTNPFRLAAVVYLLAAIVFGFGTFFDSTRSISAMRWMLVVGFLLHTFGVGLRLYLTGHMPVSNMYESVTFASWTALGLALAFEAKRGGGVAGFGAAVLGFLALMLASFMPLEEVRIHPLRAVLRSYWLNIHVTVMLLAYGAFALAAIFSIGHLVKSWAGRDPLFGKVSTIRAAAMEELAYRLVQVAWPLLTLGIALGAVWADTAWGRFWGWDPKETWAFITWIVYTIYLHTRMVMGWRDRLSSIMCVAGFAMVLLTWFGVSYLPWFAGGLHSYAAPN